MQDQRIIALVDNTLVGFKNRYLKIQILKESDLEKASFNNSNITIHAFTFVK